MSDTNTDSQKLANITIKNRERQARYYLKHKQGILDKMKISREIGRASCRERVYLAV